MIFHCFEYNVNPCCLSIIYLSVCFLSICLFVFLYICLVVCLSIGWFIQLCIVVFFFCLVCFIYVINCSQLCPELQINQILPYPFLSSGLDTSDLCPLQTFPVFTYLMCTSFFSAWTLGVVLKYSNLFLFLLILLGILSQLQLYENNLHYSNYLLHDGMKLKSSMEHDFEFCYKR